eukprot:97935_1
MLALSNKTDVTNEKKNNKIDINNLPEYTMENVEKHDTKDSGVWIVWNKLVYDVTEFLSFHPGGAGFILDVAGEDATQQFDEATHSQYAIDKANEFIIGKLKILPTEKQIEQNSVTDESDKSPTNV